MPLRLTPLRGDEDPGAFAALLAPAHGGDEAAPRQMLEQTRAFLAAQPRPDPWGSYLAWDGEAPVGSCAYKSAPDARGAVEIAYYTFPAFEGRGYAKGMIAALRELAARSGAALVFAHTLPERNASGAALEREGFAFAGEVIDPEDGPVWRWERGV
ncbi:MAG TPA: GNAT family N-acetyltransferase [Caulobacteraceae bacterium]